MVDLNTYSPWSTLQGLMSKFPDIYPEHEQPRIASYEKYDQMYWNDPKQYRLRVLEGESPIYVPTARVVVDTTSFFMAKGLKIQVEDAKKYKELELALKDFLDRESYYSRFHVAKQVGVARGDFAYHLTADPAKPEGRRISLTPLDPRKCILVHDDDEPDKVLEAHIVSEWTNDADDNDNTVYLRVLRYWREDKSETDKTPVIWHSEGIYKTSVAWYDPKKFQDVEQWLIPPGLMDTRTPAIPVYWFKNLDWTGQNYGSSEIRGLEYLNRAISQGSTDTQMTLALEGLGVYATDGGRPVNDEGVETDWEVFPGRVMEVPSGSYFRRVEGVGSITPMMDQIGYLEKKTFMASGLTDVAMGQVDVQTAQSGIALAIKFMPTLAKLEQRDISIVDRKRQMFHDWMIWMQIYEGKTFPEEARIEPELGQKLPGSETEKINSLNNMLDRGVISKAYYREEMAKLGYEFPDDMEKQIEEEKKKEAELAALNAPPGLQQNAADAASGARGTPPNPNPPGSRARNGARQNESGGTEADQTLARQARG